MLDLEQLKPSILCICHKLHVVRLDVFGSVTGDSFGPESDVDVLVEFDRSDGNLFDRYFTLKERFEALFERPVDLVVAGASKNPYFQASVERSRVNVYRAKHKKAPV